MEPDALGLTDNAAPPVGVVWASEGSVLGEHDVLYILAT